MNKYIYKYLSILDSYLLIKNNCNFFMNFLNIIDAFLSL